jgi:DNA invertase Pin-like site-specific DNA recombinase
MEGLEMPDKMKVAIYIRVAAADKSGVKSQEQTLAAFADRYNMVVSGVYADNGASGLSLDRPAFARLLEDVKAGGVSTILVKDLSRLSRSFADSSRLLDAVFPQYGVRLVGVMDGYDSKSDSSKSPLGLDKATVMRCNTALRREKSRHSDISYQGNSFSL